MVLFTQNKFTRQFLVLLLAVVVGMVLGRADTPAALALGPNAVRPGIGSTPFPGNDDGSTGLVPIGFTVNFFGANRSQLFVNNNGNVTFDSPLGTFTPFPLSGSGRAIIAPFFGDVDTRAGNIVTYGQGTVDGRPAFAVTWPGVGCFSVITSVLNHFQVVLIDRSDTGAGNFDIEFNYDRIQWETGQASGGNAQCRGGSPARVGYSSGGISPVSFELPGSGVSGAFLDSNATSGLIHNSRNTFQDGRYIFPVRNGAAPVGGSISGTVSTNPPVAGAFVQVCLDGGNCLTTQTNTLGQYSASGLPAGTYNVRALPPTGSNLFPGTLGPISLAANQNRTGQNIVLTGPTPPPPGTTITSIGTGGGGIPVVYWGSPLTLTTEGCLNGTASYEVIRAGVVVRSGAMTETPAGSGHYTAVIAPLIPNSGPAQIVITIICGGTPTTITFNIYIDPSGFVRTTDGTPIAGATVTLFRSDSAGGPFVQVPDGSGIMSPANRTNPDTTDSGGHFGWDVIAGFYRVRAEATGCVSPTNPSQTFVESAVLTIPPPVTDLDLRLSCPSADATPPEITPVVTGTLGANGWYTSDVDVSWTVTDDESAISSTSGCGSASVTTDTTGVTFTCTATSAGGTSSESVTVKVDKTGPSASLAVTAGTLGSNGWYTSDVTVSTSGSDAISGPVNCTADQQQTAETTGAVFNGSCTNQAGLTTNAAPLTVKLDENAPTTTATPTPAPNLSGWNNTNVSVALACADSFSLCASTEYNLDGGGWVAYSTPIGITAEGTHTLLFRSTDNAGLQESAKTLTVKIDKTAPEAFSRFDPATKDVLILGVDGGSGVPSTPCSPVVTPASWGGDDDDDDDHARAELRTCTIVDAAGNTLVIALKVKQGGGDDDDDDDDGKSIKATIVSLQYNGGPVISPPANSVKFEWSTNKDGTLKSLNQRLSVGKGKNRQWVSAKFDAKKNQTVIKTGTGGEDEDDDDDDDSHGVKITRPGLVLLRLVTDEGALIIEY